MARGWRDPELRNTYRRGKTIYFRHRQADGSYKVHNLGQDLPNAIRKANAIRNGDELRYLAEQIARLQDRMAAEAAAGAVVEDAAMIAKLPPNMTEVQWYKQATNQDADLLTLCNHDADILKPNTLAARHAAVKRSGIKLLSDVPNKKAAVALTDRWLADGMSRATANKTVAIMRTLWNIAEGRDMVKDNPWASVKIKTVKTDKRPYTLEEARSLLSDPKVCSVVIGLGCTGLRIDEALNATVGDDTIQVVEGKTDSAARTLYVPREVAEAIRSIQGRSKTALRTHMKAAREARGIVNADLHSWRRYLADRMMVHEVPEHVTAAVVGHKHKSLTYGHYAGAVRPEMVREVIAKVYDEMTA